MFVCTFLCPWGLFPLWWVWLGCHCIDQGPSTLVDHLGCFGRGISEVQQLTQGADMRGRRERVRWVSGEGIAGGTGHGGRIWAGGYKPGGCRYFGLPRRPTVPHAELDPRWLLANT